MQIKKGDIAYLLIQTLDKPNGQPVAPTVGPSVGSVLVNGLVASISGVSIVQQVDENGAAVVGYYVLKVPTVSLNDGDQVAVQVLATPGDTQKELVENFTVEADESAVSGVSADGAGLWLLAGRDAHRVFTTSTGGVPSDADVLPSVQIVKNGAIDSNISASVSSLQTGSYVLTVSVPADEADGVSFSAIISATIDGVDFEESVLIGVVSSVESDVDEINEHTQPICTIGGGSSGGGGGGGGDVLSVNGKIGVVVLNASDVGAATAAQGAAADTALQPGANISELVNDAGYITSAAGGAVDSVNGQTGVVTLGASDVGLGNVDNTADVDKPVSVAVQSELDTKADLVGGVIPTSQIPALAIIDFLGDVASEGAMLALSGQQGDWCLRTDVGVGYVIVGADPSVISNWQAVTVPSSAVTSVNGQTGTVVLGASDVGAATAAQGSTADTALQPGNNISELSNDENFVDAAGAVAAVKSEASSVNSQTGVSYTLQLTDEFKKVTMDNGSAVTVTIPDNASQAFPVGSEVTVLQKGAGQVTFAGDVGVVVNVNSAQTLKLAGQWAAASLQKLATDEWVVIGNMEAS